jgi:hypothetical protein
MVCQMSIQDTDKFLVACRNTFLLEVVLLRCIRPRNTLDLRTALILVKLTPMSMVIDKTQPVPLTLGAC